jgi:hypothetical protein
MPEQQPTQLEQLRARQEAFADKLHATAFMLVEVNFVPVDEVLEDLGDNS